jgi:hypothetical protein
MRITENSLIMLNFDKQKPSPNSSIIRLVVDDAVCAYRPKRKRSSTHFYQLTMGRNESLVKKVLLELKSIQYCAERSWLLALNRSRQL